MSLANYSDLKTAIENWLDRTDSVVTSNAGDFISLCNARIRQDIEKSLESNTTLSISSEYTNLPSDVLHIRMLQIDGSPDQALRYVPPDQFSILDYGGTDKPKRYTIVGNQVKVFPPPDSTYTANIEYEAAYVMTSASPTNDLMTNYPNVYLYGSLLEANIFLMDEEQATKYKMLYEEQVNKINHAEKRRKYPASLNQRARVVI